MFFMMAPTRVPSRPEMISAWVMELMTVLSALYTLALMRLSALDTLPERVSMNSLGSSMRQIAKQSAISAALAYFDGYTSARLPANLLQAQRDYFGAHTYERVDAPRGQMFHTNWTGHGGDTASTSYNA